MELLDNKFIKVKDSEFPIKITNRARIEWENLTGDSINNLGELLDLAGGHEKLLKFIYCTAKAGMKASGQDFNFTFDQFLDLIDDSNTIVVDFYKAIAKPGGEEKKPETPQI
jgi:hypothetical protein